MSDISERKGMKEDKIKHLSKLLTGSEVLLFVTGFGLGVAALIQQSSSLFLSSICLLFTCNILVALNNLRSRFLFIVFLISLFTFLIGRPLFGIINGIEGWMGSGQQEENIIFSFFLVFLTLLFLPIGAVAMDYFITGKRWGQTKNTDRKVNTRMLANLQAVTLITFYITCIFYFIVQIEPLVFMQDKNYIQYYKDFQSQLPGIVHTIASFMKYALCLFLATMPSKKRAFFPLALFAVSAVPMLIIGVRNPIMLNCLFIVVYYSLRDIKGCAKKWIGRFEKICLAVAVPGSLVFMSVYAFIRSDAPLVSFNPFVYLGQFFYGQGVTFNVLQIGYGYRKGIELLGNHYTFGGMIDYIKHGTLGQLIFGTDPLPAGNCDINGIHSNNLSHNLSYITMRKDYLSGRGRGSSYLLETYFDFGYIGVILFSLLLGALLVLMVHKFGKNVLGSTIILVSLTTIYFIPRAEATGWLTFIITIQFWACCLACYVGAFICTKVGWLQNLFVRLRLSPRIEND